MSIFKRFTDAFKGDDKPADEQATAPEVKLVPAPDALYVSQNADGTTAMVNTDGSEQPIEVLDTPVPASGRGIMSRGRLRGEITGIKMVEEDGSTSWVDKPVEERFRESEDQVLRDIEEAPGRDLRSMVRGTTGESTWGEVADAAAAADGIRHTTMMAHAPQEEPTTIMAGTTPGIYPVRGEMTQLFEPGRAAKVVEAVHEAQSELSAKLEAYVDGTYTPITELPKLEDLVAELGASPIKTKYYSAAKRPEETDKTTKVENLIDSVAKHESEWAAYMGVPLKTDKEAPPVMVIGGGVRPDMSRLVAGLHKSEMGAPIILDEPKLGSLKGIDMKRHVGTIGHINVGNSKRLSHPTLTAAMMGAMAEKMQTNKLEVSQGGHFGREATYGESYLIDIREDLRNALIVPEKKFKKRQYKMLEVNDYGPVMEARVPLPKNTFLYVKQDGTATGVNIIRWLHALTKRNDMWPALKFLGRDNDYWQNPQWSYAGFDDVLVDVFMKLIKVLPDQVDGAVDLKLEDKISIMRLATAEVVKGLRKYK